MTEVIIPYSPRQRQANAHNNMRRWNILVLHRRAGKTVFWLNELQGKKDGKWCLNITNGRFAYIAPTYKQAKNVARDLIKKYSIIIPWIVYNETELTVVYPNWSKLRLYGADNPDSLRGISLDWVVFDEYSQQPSNIFSEIIRPALADRLWWALWIWTPKGKNAFYDLFQYASRREDWQALLLKASQSGIIPTEELVDSRRLMTQDEYDQEFECSFDASIKWAYYANELSLCRQEWRIRQWIYDPLLDVYTVWDLWMSDYTAIIFFQLYGWEVRIIDEYESNNKWLDHYFNLVKDKNYRYEKHYFPHDIKVKELTSWSTRRDFAQKSLWYGKCEDVPGLKIHDGINASRMMFGNVFFDESKTEALRNALASYKQERDDKRWVFKDNPDHDWSSHYADAFRYLWVIYRKITQVPERHQVFDVSSDLFS